MSKSVAEGTKKPGLFDYFRHVKIEMKKVVWPTRKELVAYTIIVIFICAVFSILFWGLDSFFAAALKFIFKI